MSRLTAFAMGAVLALGPGLLLAQDTQDRTKPNNDPNATTSPVTSQSQDQNTSGQSTTPAATGQQSSTPQQQQNNNATTSQSTAGNQDQSTMPATNGQATSPQQQDSTTSGQGSVDQSQMSPATGQRTAQQATTPAPVGGDYNNGNTSGEADRSMPATASGWLAMLLEGGLLGGAGLTLRRVLARC